VSLDTPVLCQFCVSRPRRLKHAVHQLAGSLDILGPNGQIVFPRRGDVGMAGELLNHLHR